MTELLVQSFSTLLALIGTLAVIFGGTLLVAPDAAREATRTLDRWLPTEGIARWLSVPHMLDRLIYRYHRIFGGILVIGSIYTLYIQAFRFRTEEAVALAAQAVPDTLAKPLATAAALFLFFGNLLAFAIGVLVFLRPSLLKGMEGWANRWITLGHLARFLDRPYWETDRLLYRQPRSTGLFLVVAGLYILLVTAQHWQYWGR